MAPEKVQLRDPQGIYALKLFHAGLISKPDDDLTPMIPYEKAVAIKAAMPELEIVYYSKHDK